MSNVSAVPPRHRFLPSTDPVEFAKIVLRGIGQVMFQGHAVTGGLFLAGVAVASPFMAVGALIGAIIGPVVAHLARFDRDDIQQGIHGFNPTLVGIATLFYLKPEPVTWGLVIVGCGACVFVTYAMRRWLKFPTYTAPFVLTGWVVLVVAHAMIGTALDVKPGPVSHESDDFLREAVRGVAEVMFGASSLTGLLFIAGLAWSNWRHATLAVLGSVAGTLLAVYHNDPNDAVSIGIYGYNAALAAIAVYLWRPSLLLPILAGIVSVPLTEFFPKSIGIPPLTAPFVVAAWIILAVGRLERLFVGDRPIPPGP